jgi:hypothetical protein
MKAQPRSGMWQRHGWLAGWRNSANGSVAYQSSAWPGVMQLAYAMAKANHGEISEISMKAGNAMKSVYLLIHQP